MIILEKPYVSELLESTLEKTQIPVLKTENLKELGITRKLNFWNADRAIKEIQKNTSIPVYSNSENSIDWIDKNLSFTDLPEKIHIFKDKVKFRQLLSAMYPDYFFQGVDFNDLETLNVSEIKKPFIVKPAVGFFSIGVKVINTDKEWPEAVSSIKQDMEKVKGLYPETVMNSCKFIIEEIILGDEFAIDVYYNNEGKPVILDILKHLFSGEKDVSDRIYLTSKEIIEEHFEDLMDYFEKMGQLIELRNFPMHVEVRINENGKVIPIEVNPLRFAGWCCTDIAYYSYGLNVYEYFYKQQVPNWKEILKDKEGKIYYFTIIDVPSGVNRNDIKAFDYDGFLKNYQKVLEIRKFDFKKNAIGYVVAETEGYEEIQKILNIDYRDYITLK